MTITVTLNNVADLTQTTTAQTTINNNSTTITTGFTSALNTAGDTMNGSLDMNSNQILNLPSPATNNSPARLVDVGNAPLYAANAATSATASATSATASAASATAAATSATNAATSATNASTSATNAATQATNASTSATNASNSATTAANNATVTGVNFYNFSTTTTMADPGSANLRFNNATIASVTAMAFSYNSADTGNPSIGAYVKTWGASTSTVKGYIIIRKAGSPSNFAIFSIGAASTDNATWVQQTVTFVTSGGSFSNADSLAVQFSRTGDAGSGSISGATTHGVGIATGASAMTSTAVMTNGQLLIGQSAADPLPTTVTGDVTINNSGVTAIKTGVSLTTPNINVATATSVNKVTITPPATSAILTIADGKTLTANNTLTFSGTDSSTLAIGSGGTLTGSSSSAIFYDNIPQNSQSAAYQLVLSDAEKHIFHPSADTTARTITIPANGTVAFPIGTAVTFINQHSAGVLTIAITTDTMRLAGAGTTGSRTLAADGIATAVKITATEWIISGTGLT